MDQQIPDKIKEFADDPSIYVIIEKIGKELGLHIDQLGELDAEVRRVILGQSKSTDFSKNVSKLLEIDHGTTEKIVAEINKEIFQALRTKLQAEVSNSKENSLSSLERAGGFEIEPTVPHYGVEEAEKTGQGGTNPFTGSNQAAMMSDIENPMPSVRRTEQKVYIPPAKNPMIEPLVDQLLRGSASSPEQKIKVDNTDKSNAKPPSRIPQPPRNLPTSDPYREPMK